MISYIESNKGYFYKINKEGEKNRISKNEYDIQNLSNKYFIYNKNNNIKKYIPKIIIQTWKSNKIPIKYKKYVDSVKKDNSDFTFLFFTDKDIDKFLKKYYPIYYITYLKLPLKIQKIDFFRYVAVYHFGGFYYDLDMESLKSLDDLIKNDVVFPIEQTFKCGFIRYKYLCNHKCNIMLGNYAFGAKPNNDFIKIIITNIHDNIDNIVIEYKNNYNKYQYQYFVYQTTGPDYISLIYHKYKNKNNVKLLKNNIDKSKHTFGNYSIHRWAGSWKIQK